MDEYNKLTEEVNKMRNKIVECNNELVDLERKQAAAWNRLDSVQLAHLLHVKEHSGYPNFGYCDYRGCRFYTYDDYAKDTTVIWTCGDPEKFLIQAKGILKMMTLEEASQKIKGGHL